MDSEAQAWDLVDDLCRCIRRDARIFEDGRDPQVLDSLVLQVDLLLQHLSRLRAQDEILEATSRALAMLSQYMDESDAHHFDLQVRVVSATGPGRPRYDIPQEQLEHLLQLNFDCPTIATMLGVSLRTVRRRMDEYGLTIHSCYTDIDDARLDHIVKELKEQFPNSGYRLMDGLLRQCGIRVQQLRVRECMHRTDPNGTIVRHADLIQRRKYHVPGPQSLWHIDGNHKLIRYVYVGHSPCLSVLK